LRQASISASRAAVWPGLGFTDLPGSIALYTREMLDLQRWNSGT